MLLEPEEAEEFFRLHKALMFYVNHECRVLKGTFRTPEEYGQNPLVERVRVHDALLKRMHLIDDFIRENPVELPEKDLAVIAKWKHLVTGKFILLRQLRRHAVFLSSSSPPVAYGVVALVEPFEVVVDRPLPMFVEATLLPFKDRIIYDGVMRSQNLYLGPGLRRGFNENYNEAKARLGIVTTLPAPQERAGEPTRGATKRRARRKKADARLRGEWRIVKTSNWMDLGAGVDDVAPRLRFGARQRGNLRFGGLEGEVDYREVERDGRPAVEFSFEGEGEGEDEDETEFCSGRGWAVLEGDELRGMLFIHFGDETEFVARRE